MATARSGPSLPGSTGDFIALAQAAGAKMGNLGYAWRSQVVLGEALFERVVTVTGPGVAR